jgi:hypothetical protein
MARYGYNPFEFTADRIPLASPEELADLALATGDADLANLLLSRAPETVLPPPPVAPSVPVEPELPVDEFTGCRQA